MAIHPIVASRSTQAKIQVNNKNIIIIIINKKKNHELNVSRKELYHQAIANYHCSTPCHKLVEYIKFIHHQHPLEIHSLASEFIRHRLHLSRRVGTNSSIFSGFIFHFVAHRNITPLNVNNKRSNSFIFLIYFTILQFVLDTTSSSSLLSLLTSSIALVNVGNVYITSDNIFISTKEWTRKLVIIISYSI